tara:strand:- start:905 stop:1204 length:300 start_codon:yes stop_codon:yes gene_type:complete
MTLKITQQQMKLAAVLQGLILPMNFEDTDLEEISCIAYAHSHSEPELHKNWAELMNAFTWLNKFPFESWDQWLADDKFGFFKDNMNKSIQTFKKNGLIR